MSGRVSLGIVCAVALINCGCNAINNTLERSWTRIQHSLDLLDIRQDTRQELLKQEQEALEASAAQQRQIAQAEAKRRQMEMEFCRANQEALQRQVQSQVRDSVDSKLSFNVNQGLEIGELEVDEAALKKLLDKRAEALKRPARVPREAITRGPCNSCSEKACGCNHGLIRRLCHLCRHRRCGCRQEKDCGGPEALTRLEREPMVRPLRPTEIPLKLPVRLTFGMQNPQVTETSIRREPILGPPREPLTRDCVEKGKCQHCIGGRCRLHRRGGGLLPPPTPRPEID